MLPLLRLAQHRRQVEAVLAAKHEKILVGFLDRFGIARAFSLVEPNQDVVDLLLNRELSASLR